MGRYTITAMLTVGVEVSVEADSAEHARKLFDDNIAVNATMVDLDESQFDVADDAIHGVSDIDISEDD